jgi:uncharacterized protein YajQ (UPF0234 family)
MDEMMQGLKEKAGISQDQARKVVQFLQENKSKVPQWLGDAGGKFKDMGKNIPGM